MPGSTSIHPNALPNYEKAVIPQSKLEGYVLNPLHDEGRHKARLFSGVLGFRQQDWEELKHRLLSGLPYHESFPSGTGPWGQKYVVSLPIAGLNGNTATVRTVWIIRALTDYPSFVTALVER